MMAMMMINNMKMMMAHNMNQMAQRPQSLNTPLQKLTSSQSPGALIVDVDEPEFVQRQALQPPCVNQMLMSSMMNPMNHNPQAFLSSGMSQSMNFMGSFGQMFNQTPQMMVPNEKITLPITSRPQVQTLDKELSPKSLSPALQELVLVDLPHENLSTSTSPSTFAPDMKAVEKEKVVPHYSDFKPLTAEEVFEVQKHVFNKLP
jgi:hypothetical protein